MDATDEKPKWDRKRKVSCDCGGRYTMNNKSYHMKSRRHKHYEENNTKYVGNTSKFYLTLDELPEDRRKIKQEYYKAYWKRYSAKKKAEKEKNEKNNILV